MAGSLDGAMLDLPAYPNDKIVGLYKSSFNAATDTTRIQYTLTGSPYYAWWYKIPHSFGQPVFTDVMISTDGGVTYAFTGAMSFSDFNYMYIYAGQSASSTGNPTGTVFYKLVASWIDQYMYTDYPANANSSINNGTIYPTAPSITPVLPNQTVAFDGRFNYRKVLGVDTRAAYTSSSFTIFFPSTTATLQISKVYMECLQNQVWAIHGGGGSDPFFLDDSMVTATYDFGISSNRPYCQIAPDQNSSDWTTKLTTIGGFMGVARFWVKAVA